MSEASLTATEEAMRIDLRRRRAHELLWAMMKELDEVLPDELRGPVFDRMEWVLVQNGAYVMTDSDRADAGLEPRDAKGWTFTERVTARMELQKVMMTLFTPYAVGSPKVTTTR